MGIEGTAAIVTEDPILVERDGPVARIALNAPETGKIARGGIAAFIENRKATFH